jgi:hypothetical protein
MNIWYVTGGIFCSGLGLYLTIKQIKRYVIGKSDTLGFGIQGLGAGIMLIILGIAMIIQNI